jgi:hypothetical protein
VNSYRWAAEVAKGLGFYPAAGVFELYNKGMTPENAVKVLAKRQSYKVVKAEMNRQKEFLKTQRVVFGGRQTTASKE